jgi:hypothetical protein
VLDSSVHEASALAGGATLTDAAAKIPARAAQADARIALEITHGSGGVQAVRPFCQRFAIDRAAGALPAREV